MSYAPVSSTLVVTENYERMKENLYFETIKEKGDGCLIKYHPLGPGSLFASLTITFIDEIEVENVVNELEIQNQKWIKRYPISLMASAFDKRGDLIDLSPVKKESHLVTILGKNGIENHWKLLKNDEFPTNVLDTEFLRKTYSDISYKDRKSVV